jgi:hypothetical protein
MAILALVVVAESLMFEQDALPQRAFFGVLSE